MIGFAAERLMELEVGAATGAAYGEKDPSRRAQRNGYRDRDWDRTLTLLSSLPAARTLLADRGYDADWFRNALIARHIQPCILSRRCRKVPIPHDADLYRQRHRIENAFARLKDWRRIAPR